MKLIEFDGQDFKIADEALLMKQIRVMLKKDKSKSKEEFWSQISYLWFMCDPRSPYQYILDKSERAAEVKAQEGFGQKWVPPVILQEAMDIYEKQSTTTQSLLIEDMRYGLDSIRAMIRRIGKSVREEETDDDEDKGCMALKLDKALESMTKAVDKIPDLARKLAEAEKALAKDFEATDKARGTATKAIGEDI